MILQRASKPAGVGRCIECLTNDIHALRVRSFSGTASQSQETTTETTSSPAAPPPSPERLQRLRQIVQTPRGERRLLVNHNARPISSRRRRAALQSTANIPFSRLPYQCFQEARSVLLEDRATVIADIDKQRQRIERVKSQDVAPENEARKEHRLRSMRKRLEELKLMADINDPLVKKRFEDNRGDMAKPIYRHLSDLKWRGYKRKVLMQRLETMNVIPDVLPTIDPTVSTVLAFGRKTIPHGAFVSSLMSLQLPTLTIQPYNAGTRLVTIAVVTPDLPDVATDSFTYRAHFLASNIPISPTETHVSLSRLSNETQTILPWLPPFSQMGAPYQRLCIFILEQNGPIDVSVVKNYGRFTVRENFVLKSFVHLNRLTPVGADVFRSQWDEGTAEVMRRIGAVGADVAFKRKKIEPLPYKRLKGERFR